MLEETAGRPSVLVRARGSDRSPAARTLLLCGHTDTVNVDGMSDPHAPRRDGDRLHGRGAYDMKAGVAAALIACREAAAMGPCRRGMGQHRRHRGRGADHRRGRGPPVRVRALGPDSRVALVATEGLTASART